MKPILTVTLVSLILVGCGESSSSSSAGTTEAPEKPVVGVSIPAATHGWTGGVNWWAEQAMAEHDDIEFVYSTASDSADQISDIEDMMVRGVDGLVVLAFESEPLTDVASRAKERGIYIVNIDRGFTEPVANVFLEGDNKAFGRKSAEFMVDKLGGTGKIVILRGIPSTVDTDRFDAAMEVFDAAEGIEVLDVQPAFWNRQKGLEAMETILQKHPEIDAVWAQDDDIALGAEQAILEAKREDEMWIFPGAGMNTVVKRVMDGDPMFPANMTYPPAMIAAGVHLAAAGVTDGDEAAVYDLIPAHLHVPKDELLGVDASSADGQRHIKLDVYLITPDNAEQYYFPDSVY